MHIKNCRRNEINFLTDRLTLPLFLATRVSSRKNNEYITRTEQIIKKMCEEEKQPNTKMRSVYEKLIGKYAENPQPCINLRRTKMVREHSDTKHFHLPPNIYKTDKIPFENRRGLGGAYWHRSPTTKSTLGRNEAQVRNWQFYNLPRDIDRLVDRHNQYKGKFRTKIPKGRGTKWNSQSSLAKAFPPRHRNLNCQKISQKVINRTNVPKPNPHLFLQRSCVPEKLMSYIPRHQSFLPSVGRYEIRSTTNRCLCVKTKRKLSHPRAATSPNSLRNDGQRRLLLMLDATTLTKAKLLDDKQDKLQKRIPISRRPQKLMPTKQSNIRFNAFIAKPMLKANPSRVRPAQKGPAARSAAPIKHFHLSHKGAVERKQFASKIDYRPNFRFQPPPSPKILATKEEIFADLSPLNPPRFYFRELDSSKYLKKSTVNIAATKY